MLWLRSIETAQLLQTRDHRRGFRRQLLLLLCLLLSGGQSLWSQFDNSAVLGVVHDPAGAAVPDATLILTSNAKGTTLRGRTDSSGLFEFSTVQAGDYSLSAQADGFTSAVTDIFSVTVGSRQRVDIGLKLGSAGETVTVSDVASPLQTDSSDRGGTVEAEEAVTLPLNGRAYANLAKLVPGVRQSLIGVVSNPPREASFNVNGLTAQMNNFLLDGIDNNGYQEANQGFSNQAVIPSPDAIQEFRVVTDNYSAEYGRTGGGVINVTTRSGGNQYHGVAYDYLRNTKLNAFGPFLGTGIKPTLVQNQFGGRFSGPVRRNRIFFFTDYEGLRSTSHSLTTANVPTQAELTGLFTSDGTTGGTPIPLRNPYTGVVYANGQIPLNDPNIDPLALTVFKLLPVPNIPGAAITASNFQYLPASSTVDDKGDGRTDFVVTPRQNGFLGTAREKRLRFSLATYPVSQVETVAAVCMRAPDSLWLDTIGA